MEYKIFDRKDDVYRKGGEKGEKGKWEIVKRYEDIEWINC